LLHEAVRRKWTTDKKLIGYANGHPLLSQALKENVAFLRDDVLDAQRINLDRRTFRPKTEGLTTPIATLGQGILKNAGTKGFVYRGAQSIAELYDAESDIGDEEDDPANLGQFDY
jgi:hypothetical protein